MIEEPGSFSGSASSPRPERGPEPSRRMSLAILNRLAATVLMAPWLNTMASWAARASNLLGAVVKARPVMAAMRSATILSKPTGAFRPVPTAVPPWASCISLGMVCFDAGDAIGDLGGIAGKFLAQGQRRRVLGMGAADLDDVFPGRDLGLQRPQQMLQRGQQRARSPRRRRCAWRWDRCRWTTGSY